MLKVKAELFQDLNGTIEGLCSALQNAIELEHSTIPPYLYALYSLKPGTNLEIAGLIKSVVLEEMLHMSLDCNVLNAIKGAPPPKIDDPCFLPKYPGHLPGMVEGQLIVPLAPFSKQLLWDIFMVIEEPEHRIDIPVKDVALAATSKPLTIGQFYAGIIEEIKKLKPDDFSKDSSKQLTVGFAPLQKIHVHDAESAIAAIKLIVDQGEGTEKDPLDVEHEPAHYYRFAEIYYGKKLVPNPDPKPGEPDFAYAGHNIQFDPAGVWPVITNPHRENYPANSQVAILNDTFNYTYTSLLKSLQHVFNGEPDRLGPAIGLMESMKEQALQMMSTTTVPGQTAGPSFQYTPVNPWE